MLGYVYRTIYNGNINPNLMIRGHAKFAKRIRYERPRAPSKKR